MGMGHEHTLPVGKMIASQFGGARHPLVIAWSDRIKDRAGIAPNSTTSSTSRRRSWRQSPLNSSAVNGVTPKANRAGQHVYTFDDGSLAAKNPRPSVAVDCAVTEYIWGGTPMAWLFCG
jgi:hypothetical protein